MHYTRKTQENKVVQNDFIKELKSIINTDIINKPANYEYNNITKHNITITLIF